MGRDLYGPQPHRPFPLQVLLQDQNKDTLEHQRKMDDVNQQMAYWGLPAHTRDDTRAYYEYLWHRCPPSYDILVMAY